MKDFDPKEKTIALYMIEVNRNDTTSDIKYYYAIKITDMDADKLHELDKKMNKAQKLENNSEIETLLKEKEQLIAIKPKYLLPASVGAYYVGDIIKKERVPDTIAILLETSI